MKPTQGIFTLLCLLSLPSQAVAFDEGPWPTPKLVRFADLIVVGMAAEERGKMFIGVSTVLKGEKTERVALSRVEAGIYRDVVIKPGNKGIIYVLNERFTGWSVTSKEVASFTWRGPSFHEVAPWQEKGGVALQCRANSLDAFKVSVTSAEPKGDLSECLKHHLLIAFKGLHTRQTLPPNFTVTLNARLPERAGSVNGRPGDAILASSIDVGRFGDCIGRPSGPCQDA